MRAVVSEEMMLLEWWKAHAKEYPQLAKLAEDYLSIQASSVPCEQLFSSSGQLLSKRRARMKSNIVQANL